MNCPQWLINLCIKTTLQHELVYPSTGQSSKDLVIVSGLFITRPKGNRDGEMPMTGCSYGLHILFMWSDTTWDLRSSRNIYLPSLFFLLFFLLCTPGDVPDQTTIPGRVNTFQTYHKASVLQINPAENDLCTIYTVLRQSVVSTSIIKSIIIFFISKCNYIYHPTLYKVGYTLQKIKDLHWHLRFHRCQ